MMNLILEIKVFSEINMDDLKQEDGIQVLITFMDGIF